MNIIINLLYGFALLSIFAPSHAPAMMRHMQEQATEPKLELWHNHQKIAEIPVSVAKKISPVFKQQLCGSKVFDTRLCASMEMKQDKVIIVQDSLKINVSDEFNPEAVTLFTHLVNVPTTFANPPVIPALSPAELRKVLIHVIRKMLIHANRDLVIDLYHFLTTYDINKYIPLLAEHFACELALTNDLYNHPIFPFFANQQFRILIQAVCSLPAYSMVLVQEPMVIQHTDMVDSAQFSPDGKYVVTASRDRTAKVYDITEQKVIGTIAHTAWVNSATFSPNGKYIVTASSDNTAKVYDITAQKVIRTIPHKDWLNSATFSPNGKYIVTASSDNTAKIYDITAQKVIDTIAHTAWVNSAIFSPDGKYVVTASNDTTAKIYDMETKQVIGTITHAELVNSATFSPDGKYVVTASEDKTAQIYDIEKKQVIDTIAHTNKLNSAVFSPDGKYVVTASWDKTAQIYDREKKQVIGTIAHTNGVVFAQFSPDGKYVVTASYDKTAQIYDIAKKQVIDTIAHTKDVHYAQFSPDGRYIITASRDSTARITPVTLCGMPDMQVITIATLIEIAKRMAAAEEVEPLAQTGWLYKEFKKLSANEQQRLSTQFPQIKELIDNAQDDQQQKQGKKQ